MTENKVLVSTDCVSDLTKELQEKYEIPVMYYYVRTEEARFQDTNEMTSDDLIEYIELDGKKAYSGCASAEEYKEYFENLKNRTGCSVIIHICMAKDVSDAFDTAGDAAKSVGQVYVVDSGHLSGGMGIMVLAAADMARRGASCEIILKELERMKRKISSSFIVDSTDYLYRNGRINKNVAALCKALSLHPILKLKDSKMMPAGICMGNQKRLARVYIRWALRKKEKIVPDIVFLITAGCSYEFQQFLKKEIEKRVKWKKIIVNTASATISCNCGSGAFGVLFLTR